VSEDVLIRAEGGLGRMRLNRPDALNALTTEMCLAMTDALLKWRADDDVRIVMLDHASGRGFCAGGDVRALYESVKGDGAAADAFFAAEYRLDTLIQSYPKPYVAFMDGVTMGGGVGVSVHGSYRVVTDNTVFAMPETGIGLFPDVGGGWFLPRLPGQIGAFMGLTGARLKGADCVRTGIATHFAPEEVQDAMKAQIAGAARTHDPGAALRSGLEALSEEVSRGPLDQHRAKIDALFAGESVEAIAAALEADGSDWAQAQRAMLQTKSPLSLKVALRQIREGGRLASFRDVMAMEYRIARRLVRAHDFSEGVRALIVEKDNAPLWAPAALADVTPAMIDEVFSPLDAGAELRFLD
jgi:enoyl-CoA hydratase